MGNFKAARLASGLSRKDAAELAGISVITLDSREEKPETFRIGELRQIYGGLNMVGRRLMRESVSEFFLE